VLVRVEASSVNGFDLGVASGMVKGMIEYELPIVLGRDYGGTIEAVGPGVTGFEVGDPVFGVFMKMTLGAFGTFSELVAAPAMFAAKIPNGLAVESAAAPALAGAPALAAIDAIDPKPDETVLISGATGGVGSFAVQLAKERGATVIATAKPEDADYVTSLGADETVDCNRNRAGYMNILLWVLQALLAAFFLAAGAFHVLMPFARLKPLAAIGVVLMFLGAIALHVRRGEVKVIGMHIVVIALALVVIWGRTGPYSLN